MGKLNELPADASPGGQENYTYQLMRRLRSGEFVGRYPELGRRCRHLLRIFESTSQASDRMRREARAVLPPEVSPTLVPRVEAVIDQAGEDLRKHLFEVFSDELDRAVAAERARDAAQYDCVRCEPGTKGRMGVPGVGWLCARHLEEHERGA